MLKVRVQGTKSGTAFIPANIELAGLETALVNVMSREMILKQYLDTVKAEYDYILIDCIRHTEKMPLGWW